MEDGQLGDWWTRRLMVGKMVEGKTLNLKTMDGRTMDGRTMDGRREDGTMGLWMVERWTGGRTCQS